MKIILCLIGACLSSCSILQPPYEYIVCESEYEISSTITENKVTGVSGSDLTQLSGVVIADMEPDTKASIEFRSLEKNTVRKTPTDFDGNYSIELPSGKYRISRNGEDLFNTIEIGPGEIRKIDFEITLASEVFVEYVIEFKSKHQYRRFERSALKKEMSLLEYLNENPIK